MRRKAIKEIGKWMADRGYDAWDIFITEGKTKRKWCRFCGVTKHPIREMLKSHSFANINWKKVTAVKLT